VFWAAADTSGFGWLRFGCSVGEVDDVDMFGKRRFSEKNSESREGSSAPNYCCHSYLCNITYTVYRNVNYLLLLNFEHLACGMLSCFLESIC
jgi:hypothetical protein